ncbi:hypothetical protein EPO44_19270 [bacterium]|nr:MAG: hypothetical protein EPO44_19270 [bacterium]
MFPPTIADYYRKALEGVRQEVQSTPDDRAIGTDIDEWVQYLVTKYAMEPIDADLGAMKMEETTRNGYPAVRVFVPVAMTDTFKVIAQNGLAGGGAWLGFDYKTFFSHSHPGTIGQVERPDPNHINAAKRRITEYVQCLNDGINHENKTFPEQVRQIVVSRQKAVKAKHKNLDELSATVGIPLVKRTDISTIVPTAVRVRKTIAPLVPPAPKAQQRPVLERDKFEAIIELIDNQCQAFERTPAAYQVMTEEMLRDVILSSLNGVFEGAATGEAFQGLGKTDIHLRISQGEVFISELKMWDGPAALAEVVKQLLERLTWRETYGVAIVISRNADFTGVLRSIEKTLPQLPEIAPGSLRKLGENAFVARFSLPSDPLRQVEIHVRAYNIYTSRRAGRSS